MSRMDQYEVTVSLRPPGARADIDLGTWDKMSGGEKDSEETKYRPGGMGAEVTLGGYTTVGNVTLSRLFKRTTENVDRLLTNVGKGIVTITKQSLDTSGNAFGNPIVYKGILKRVTPPEVDSESADAALIEIEITSASIDVQPLSPTPRPRPIAR